MNAANSLTILRITLVPVIIFFLGQNSYATATWIFLVAGVTDALDGFIARRFGQVTQLGSILDPVADKALIISTVIVLACKGLLPWWLATAVIVRDIIILGGAGAWYRKTGHLDMDPSWPSKINTFFQIVVIYLVLGNGAGLIRIVPWISVIFHLAVVTTIVSGIHYIIIWGRRARLL